MQNPKSKSHKISRKYQNKIQQIPESPKNPKLSKHENNFKIQKNEEDKK